MSYPALTPGLALDIDETLSVTGVFWIEQLITSMGHPDTSLSAEDILHKHWYYGETIGHWDRDEVNRLMRLKCACNDEQRILPLQENANHIVEKISRILPISAYITARPDTVIEGTKDWLAKHGFPERPIIARPAAIPGEEGNNWKAGVLTELYPVVRGIVDDNPNLISALPADYDGTVFLFNHLSYDHDTTINVIPCKDWESIHLEIKRMAHLFGILDS